MENYTGEANPRAMFVEGAFGTGKTAFAIETLFAWLDSGIAPEKILVIVPQRTLARRYLLALRDSEHGPLGDVEIRTLGGLAKDTVNLYWPLVAKGAGFTDARLNPRFLTIETSQYAMADFVTQAVERGEFDAINVSPQQIARQIVDNLGKAAIMGVSYDTVPERLIEAWGPERPRKRALAYQAAGRVAQEFRQYCVNNRLLDYSLQIEIFSRLLARPDFQEKFYKRRTHLIVDHVEEEPALTHDLIRAWLPHLEGALLVYEQDSGYRVFLGADPQGATRLRDACDGVLTLNQSYVTTPEIESLHRDVAASFSRPGALPAGDDAALGFEFTFHNYYPQMMEWVAENVARLVNEEGVSPREIVILAPFLSDALRFSLGQKLEARGIASLSHRPSRALRDEPAARTLLTLTALAHPQWDIRPPQADVAQALQQAIAGLDPVRARLLARVVYHPRGKQLLSAFDIIKPDMQSRVTFVAGQRYERLRAWLLTYSQGKPAPLDHFLSRLFGEALSQPGYGFHTDPDAGRVAAELVESARKFRRELFAESQSWDDIGKRYFDIVKQGLLAALYVASWRDELAEAVFMAPAYTFLMRNRAADVQFWLDVGSLGWWERLDQPLTHPYVLSRSWEAGQVWSDADEFDRQQDMLYRIVSGLLRRCRRHVYLGISDLGEQGYEQRGPMLRLFQQILRRHPRAGEAAL
jgi:UvrD-like helicase family protein